ncbi:MAG TPA: heparin lyase I family protein [Burkholderiales bacterium]|nr:heparin lyase I family protein [Burkholderiales bacterium]
MKGKQHAGKAAWLGGSVALAFAATMPAAHAAAPQFEITAPSVGGILSGDVKGPDSETPCVVQGTNIQRVMFYLNDQWTNTDGRLENGLGCWIDTTKYEDGTYTLKAVAYSPTGETSTKTREIRIQNGSASGGAGSDGGPTIAFTAPAAGGVLSGDVKGPDSATPCVVEGTNIQKVMFYLNDQWTNTDGNLANGLGCWIDTTKYKDGTYTVKAVAYSPDGATATATREIQIRNSTAPNPSDGGAPTVAFTAPAPGGVLSGNVKGPDSATPCVVQGTNIARVMFYLNDKWTNTDGNLANGLGCWIDTTKYADGTYTVKAVAYNAAGATATATRQVTIKNGSTSGGGDSDAPSTSPIAKADIIGWAAEDVPFREQGGYGAQILGTYPSASSIPESGIHGSRLSNGETLRLGKDVDPANKSKKALAFQLHPNDKSTSGSKRAEISFQKNIEHNKTYWVAYRVYVRDWGTLSSSDKAIFGTQLHSGDNSRGLSPSFSIVATNNGRSMQVYTVTSTSSSPSQGNSVTTRHPAISIPFGRWVDFVFKVRQNTKGNGLLQVWMDGKQIVNYKGNLGFNTPGHRDYMKFGYYNWSSGFNSARKVMMKKPTIVLDPTGSKYSAADLRAHINR